MNKGVYDIICISIQGELYRVEKNSKIVVPWDKRTVHRTSKHLKTSYYEKQIGSRSCS